jgi:hypothetical protein
VAVVVAAFVRSLVLFTADESSFRYPLPFDEPSPRTTEAPKGRILKFARDSFGGDLALGLLFVEPDPVRCGSSCEPIWPATWVK